LNILSFDIEEWFHLLDNRYIENWSNWESFEVRIHKNVERILTLLEDNNTKATFFCLGWIAEKYPEVIRSISDSGYEIASHSHMHKLAYDQSRKQFTEDLVKSIQCLEDITGKKVRAYRAPGFSLKEENKWVFEILIEHGIEIDCSIFPASRAHGGFENFGVIKPCIVDVSGHRIKEFPINIRPLLSQRIIFSGGGYFRFFPPWVIQRFMQQSDYVMTYFHPRDFDPQQPRLPTLSLARKFRTYYGLKNCYQKLDMLLKSHKFIDIASADDMIDWNDTAIKYL
jgi:polysaccharide deacetylase family protein (PEP-CTERM system associated)